MAAPMTARSSPISSSFLGNGPDSPPVLFQPVSQIQEDDEDERCRSCFSAAMFTDWKQGDRVCTNCGVVAEASLRDSRPEWKDFNEAEDLVKGLPSGARCGMVPVDESKYIGGLQPTSLSKEIFGGGVSNIRKQLINTNRKSDRLMEKIHHKALKDAKLDRSIRKKQKKEQPDSQHSDNSIRPELESLILQEEEDAHQIQQALYSEKWSMDRALVLHGDDGTEEQREELVSRMDKTLRTAAYDLYTAHSMLIQAAQSLHLPDRVQSEVVHRLLRFITRKDGIRIPGVASRLSKDASKNKEAAEKLKDFNKRKQMAALCAAILFLTARGLGWTRSMVEIASSFTAVETNNFIKPKHMSKAMKEIQVSFPEYCTRGPSNGVATASNQQSSKLSSDKVPSKSSLEYETANFAEHSIRRLQLPPVAEASISTLLIYCRAEQMHLGRNSGTKLSTLCSAVTYFVCHFGSIMQRLAQQVPAKTSGSASLGWNDSSSSNSELRVGRKRALANDVKIPRKAKKRKSENSVKSSPGEQKASSSLGDDKDYENESKMKRVKEEDEEEPFDVFSHAPIVEDSSENQKYEMRRMWDAWREQMPWQRSAVEIEQACGVSRNKLLDFYKADLYPRREALLNVLKTGVTDGGSENKSNSLQETPLAPILLVQIMAASPLMTNK